MPIGQVITFYSYKGGVGRTFALADIGVILARWGYRVLCIDWDLEAPGLDVYFTQWLGEPRGGLLELLEAYRGGTALDWRATVEFPAIPGAERRLEFIRSGRVDPGYGRRVQAVDWDSLYAQGFGAALEHMRADWQREYDFVLIDSRTGLSDSGGVCTIQLPSTLVVLFTPNEQSMSGVLRVAQTAKAEQAKLPIDRPPLRVIPVLTRVDSTEYEEHRTWTRRITQELGPLIEEWSDAPGEVEAVISLLAVPYVPYWSYGERLPALRDESSNRLSVGFAHETLAALLADESASIRGLISRREATVSRVRLASVEFQHDVFVSYSSTDREFVTLLVHDLISRGVKVFSDMMLRPGDRRLELLAEARASSRVAVIVVGKQIGPRQGSEIAEMQEISARDSQRRRIIPVIRKGVDSPQLPAGLDQYHGLCEEDFDTVDKLAAALATALRDVR